MAINIQNNYMYRYQCGNLQSGNGNVKLNKPSFTHNLGYRLMIDFHYSDRWADPVQQAKPKAVSYTHLDVYKRQLER